MARSARYCERRKETGSGRAAPAESITSSMKRVRRNVSDGTNGSSSNASVSAGSSTSLSSGSVQPLIGPRMPAPARAACRTPSSPLPPFATTPVRSRPLGVVAQQHARALLQVQQRAHQRLRLHRQRVLLTRVLDRPADVVQQPHQVPEAQPQLPRLADAPGVDGREDVADRRRQREHQLPQRVTPRRPTVTSIRGRSGARTTRIRDSPPPSGDREQWPCIEGPSFGAGPGVSQAPPGRFTETLHDAAHAS